MNVKRMIEAAFKKKEVKAKLGIPDKKATYQGIAPPSKVGKADIKTKITSR
jgi:hypothetical protein